MANKLIKDMDEETWRRFIAFCKLKNIKASDELKEILENYISKNLSSVLAKKPARRKVK